MAVFAVPGLVIKYTVITDGKNIIYKEDLLAGRYGAVRRGPGSVEIREPRGIIPAVDWRLGLHNYLMTVRKLNMAAGPRTLQAGYCHESILFRVTDRVMLALIEEENGNKVD